MAVDLSFSANRPAIVAADLQTRVDQLLRTYTCRNRYHYGDCNCLEAVWVKIIHQIQRITKLKSTEWLFNDRFYESLARDIGTGCYMGSRPQKMWRSFLPEMVTIIKTVVGIVTDPRTTGEGSCA